MGKLDGKVAIITGAARGQGEAEARLFVEEGARVDARRRARRARGAGRRLRSATPLATCTSTSPTRRGGPTSPTLAVDTFGHLDVLVNNAAVHHIVRIEDESLEGFERILRVNLVGTFLGIRTCAPALRAAGRSSIVNISSTAGLLGYVGHGAYGASKWGVRGM